MLKTLSEAFGPSGCEKEVRKRITDKIKPYADRMFIDKMGNLLALKKGKSAAHLLMVSAHMDEVGLIVSAVTADGYLKFKTVGGIDPRVLVSKSVRIGKNRVPGVIALKAVHLQTADERKAAVQTDKLCIDIGAGSREEALSCVEIGAYAVFDTAFSAFGDGLYMGKAFDDRAGCAILTELIADLTPVYDTYFCFTVQEEVGCRGAAIAAARICPDAALVVEGTTCSDVSGVPAALEVTTLGGGGALSIADGGSYSDKTITNGLYAAAQASGIPVQYKRTTMGGNDARSIQRSGSGVKTAVVSLPTRYLHAPVSVISKRDYESVKRIAALFLMQAEEWI